LFQQPVDQISKRNFMKAAAEKTMSTIKVTKAFQNRPVSAGPVQRNTSRVLNAGAMDDDLFTPQTRPQSGGNQLTAANLQRLGPQSDARQVAARAIRGTHVLAPYTLKNA
jgi:hypothetical protein